MQAGGADNLWQIVATFLVLLMQCGFLMLEGGRVRSKNSVNVAQKNVSDLVVVWVGFLVAGFFVMYGVLPGDLLTGNGNAASATPLSFVFQFAFACTTATIISGAIAERVAFRAYLLLIVSLTTLIYPLVGRLVWGNTYDSSVSAPLAELGFVDFAGSTVVHGTGAWFALVAMVMIGPRVGRFDANGKVLPMAANSSVMALFGVLILMLGWLGFNGGSVSPSDPLLQRILFNTVSAACFGALVGMLVGVRLDSGVFNPGRVATGLLGGLVACTAGIHAMSLMDAVLIGALGGFFATFSAEVLLHRFRLDDPLDVVAIHGVAGVVGTLAVAFVLPESALASGSRLLQAGVQLLGVTVVFLIAGVGSWLTVSLIKRYLQYRVPEHAERIGLNYTEHGESIGMSRLQKALEDRSAEGGKFSTAPLVDVGDEHAELAATLSTVMQKFEHANNEVIAANGRFQQFAETATDWLWESDANLSICFVHASSHQAELRIQEALLGRHLLDVLTIEADVVSRLNEVMAQQGNTPVFEAVLRPWRDRDVCFDVEVRGVVYKDSAGKYRGYRGTMTDITERKSAETRALYLSMHDELTGLRNRRALTKDLPRALHDARSAGHAVVVAGVDLDGFKAVNDVYGHMAGDELLRQVSERFQQFLRVTDSAYRTGGDEFVVVLGALDISSVNAMALAISQRMIEELSNVYQVQSLSIDVGASVGIVVFPDDDSDFDELLRKADLALYAAKAQGKGCAVAYESAMDAGAQKLRDIERELLNGIRDNQFYLEYQPQINTLTGDVVGYEALIRWVHPEHGLIPPNDFIPVAERMNLMERIGAFVLDTACEFAASWPIPENRDPLTIAVNVSPIQLRSDTFLASVLDTLTKHGLAPERLELEITEDVLVRDFAEVAGLLQQLRTLGISVAVDDFGSGQTSLRYLSQFPLSTIKIDRSFVNQVVSDSKSCQITQAIVELGHRLGLSVIAEGVETAQQLALLNQCGCDQIQGFLFSRPVSAQTVMASFEAEVQAQVQRKAG